VAVWGRAGETIKTPLNQLLSSKPQKALQSILSLLLPLKDAFTVFYSRSCWPRCSSVYFFLWL